MSSQEIFWLAQIIGLVALLLGAVSWNLPSKKKILYFQGLASATYFLHYLLLGGTAGALMNLVTFFRSIVFSKKEHSSWAKSDLWIYFFMALSVTLVGLFWRGWADILPVCGVILGTWALSRQNPREIRIYMLLTIAFWTPYVIIIQSYSGLLSQVVGVVSIVLGMIRLDSKKLK